MSKLIKELEELKAHLKECYTLQKKLANSIKDLEAKIVKKKPRIVAKPITEMVPSCLIKLLKLKKNTKLTRSDVAKLLHEYFTKNKLYNKKTKEIKLNAELKKIFILKKSETLDFYNFQNKLRKIYD